MKEEGSGGELGSDLDRQNDADPLDPDPDPQHCLEPINPVEFVLSRPIHHGSMVNIDLLPFTFTIFSNFLLKNL